MYTVTPRIEATNTKRFIQEKHAPLLPSYYMTRKADSGSYGDCKRLMQVETEKKN
jgi:hypothetical protein